MIAIFFNLFVNSAFSLLVGLIVIGFFFWLFRVETDRWKLFLLSLPFIKIIYDFTNGVSSHSILFSNIDPYALPPRHQIFTVGGGLGHWTVFLNAAFKVVDLNGITYDTTVGDYLYIWLQRTFSDIAPLLILASILAISFLLILIRSIQILRFETIRRYDRKKCIQLRLQKIGWRWVDIYVSNKFSGTPFTGGIFKPYICIPYNAAEKLSTTELEAVIAHELGHVLYFDLVITMLIQFLGDVFWFVPGYRWLSKKIDRIREVTADQAAIDSGIDPTRLASALISLREIPEINDKYVLYSAFFRSRSLLKERVERLLDKTYEKPARFGWQNKWLRTFISIIITGAVINSVFGGNHKMLDIVQNPEWFTKLLHAFGKN